MIRADCVTSFCQHDCMQGSTYYLRGKLVQEYTCAVCHRTKGLTTLQSIAATPWFGRCVVHGRRILEIDIRTGSVRQVCGVQLDSNEAPEVVDCNAMVSIEWDEAGDGSSSEIPFYVSDSDEDTLVIGRGDVSPSLSQA